MTKIRNVAFAAIQSVFNFDKHILFQPYRTYCTHVYKYKYRLLCVPGPMQSLPYTKSVGLPCPIRVKVNISPAIAAGTEWG